MQSPGTVPILRMRDVHCRHIEYEIEIPLDKFDLDAFKREIGAPVEAKRDARVCNTGDPSASDYHVHFGWQLLESKAAIELDLDYFAKITKPRPNEKEPLAEDVMAWLGRFSKFPDVSARISTDFVYGGEMRFTMFPLPIKTTPSELGAEIEINGITFGLPSQPRGIYRVYVTQKAEGIALTFQSERRLTLQSFSLSEQLKIASDFAEKLVT